MTYEEQLKDQRWIDLRNEVVLRDCGICQRCMSSKHLNVHHTFYENGKKAWEYPMKSLVTLCYECHKLEHNIEDEDPMISAGIRIGEAICSWKALNGS